MLQKRENWLMQKKEKNPVYDTRYSINIAGNFQSVKKEQ